MSAAEPLSREEREEFRKEPALWHTANHNVIEATLRAAEAEREDWMRRGLAAVERADRAEAEAAGLRAALEEMRRFFGFDGQGRFLDREQTIVAVRSLAARALAAHPSPASWENDGLPEDRSDPS